MRRLQRHAEKHICVGKYLVSVVFFALFCFMKCTEINWCERDANPRMTCLSDEWIQFCMHFGVSGGSRSPFWGEILKCWKLLRFFFLLLYQELKGCLPFFLFWGIPPPLSHCLDSSAPQMHTLPLDQAKMAWDEAEEALARFVQLKLKIFIENWLLRHGYRFFLKLIITLTSQSSWKGRKLPIQASIF